MKVDRKMSSIAIRLCTMWSPSKASRSAAKAAQPGDPHIRRASMYRSATPAIPNTAEGNRQPKACRPNGPTPSRAMIHLPIGGWIQVPSSAILTGGGFPTGWPMPPPRYASASKT